MKKLFKILLIFVLVAGGLLSFNAFNKYKSRNPKINDYFLAIVSVKGEYNADVNFYDKELNNIKKLELKSKGMLSNYNMTAEEDKDFYYLLDNTTKFGLKKDILRIRKSDFKQDTFDIGIYPDYFYVGDKYIYAMRSLRNSCELVSYDKNSQKQIKKDTIYHDIPKTMFEYKKDLHYFTNEKSKINILKLGNTTPIAQVVLQENEASLDREIVSSYVRGDNLYILSRAFSNTDMKPIDSYTITKYNLNSGKIKNMKLKDDKFKYTFGNILYFHNKLILQEDTNLGSNQNNKHLVYLDLELDKLNKIEIDEYPSAIKAYHDQLITVDDNNLTIYNSGLKQINKKSIKGISKNDNNNYILMH